MDAKYPKSLTEAIRYFKDFENCRRFMVEVRWPDGKVRCPRCGSENVTFLENARLWKCYSKHPSVKFSLKVGTIFEDSAIGLEKWLPAMWLIANCKNGISSYELADDLRVTQKTAWFMLHRIRLAMQIGSLEKKFVGDVEADETFIGGLARFMHADQRKRMIKGHGRSGQGGRNGPVERHGPDKHSRVTARPVPNVQRSTLVGEIRKNVETGSQLFSDAWIGYKDIDPEYVHHVIDHAEAYANGRVHLNGIENFWSLLKRGLKGTYISVEPFHLFRYVDEQAFRFNNRKAQSADRFNGSSASVVGRRLTYQELTGKTLNRAARALIGVSSGEAAASW